MHQISLFSYPQNPKAAVFNSDPSIHLRGELPREAGVRWKSISSFRKLILHIHQELHFVETSADLVHVVP